MLPLNAVLFPWCVLDLQFFEARYLDMIGRGMKQGEGFGVVCISEGSEVGAVPVGFSLIGCEALVTYFHQQENGLLG
ncbi:LON peptidase substrate-binding domain-containing protein, partial [Pseudomonas syringae group genomosp. 7]|uniref:LON peptidase substrate-binding domain-containing protein n=1 Tax=Pseudomonas syringae group genomosp. 7 TaxID=251699 RepID=UPI0037704C48